MPIHFVWATHRRQPSIPEAEQRRVWRQIHAACEASGCDVLAVGGVPNHVHLLVNLSSTTSMAALMKRVKGSASRFITDQLLNGAWFAWQEHYAALAVEPARTRQVIAYIHNQAKHHAAGTTIEELEQTHTETEVPGPSSQPDTARPLDPIHTESNENPPK